MEIGDRVKTQNGTEGTIENIDAQFVYVRDDFDSLVVTKMSCLTPIGDTKITEQEYKIVMAEQFAEIKSLKAKTLEAQRRQNETIKAFCKTLTEQYADFIGKKVSITFVHKVGCNMSYTNRVGYLRGFRKAEWRDEIRPILAKVKKDGTESLVVYPDYMMESYDSIAEIKLQD